jgi:hypothetical protein
VSNRCCPRTRSGVLSHTGGNPFRKASPHPHGDSAFTRPHRTQDQSNTARLDTEGHFSTDISYLPELERYLADLLRHRERLTATLDADEWARNEAMPSNQEITRVRRLINRMKGDLDDLAAEDRTQIEDAVTLVSRSRIKIVDLGLPRVRQPLPDLPNLRPERIA